MKDTLAPDDDAGLVALSRQGDLAAFEQLVAKHQKKMFNIAFRISGDYDDASENAQDAFVAAYRGIRDFRGDSKFSTWLTTITMNQARNRLKQTQARQRHEVRSLDDPIEIGDGTMTVDPPSHAPSALDRLEQCDVGQSVQKCIKALDQEFREVLVLRDMQEFSYAEISAMLKVREGTVKSRLFRARESIKDCLKQALDRDMMPRKRS